MTTATSKTYTEAELYPSYDGNSIAESTLQFDWIVLIKENLERFFADQPLVFIAGDLLWYPVEVAVPPAPAIAPDVMVVFGRPKGTRKSYQQFREENIPPQVVFEVLSDSNKDSQGREAMQNKLLFYEQYGVEEYYVIDPEELILEGWLRERSQSSNRLVAIPSMSDWVSPRLGIRFDYQQGDRLDIYSASGEKFKSVVELDQERRNQQITLQTLAAKSQKLADKLRELGIDPDSL
jgi:Uma2 family endonuclease